MLVRNASTLRVSTSSSNSTGTIRSAFLRYGGCWFADSPSFLRFRGVLDLLYKMQRSVSRWRMTNDGCKVGVANAGSWKIVGSDGEAGAGAGAKPQSDD